MPLTVGMLLFPSLTQLDLTGPYEVFFRLPDTKVFLISTSTDPVVAAGGMRILPDCLPAQAPALDILFVPGGSGVNQLFEDKPILEFLRDRAKTAKYITSVCTGSLVLGAAGLLDGYRAATHWLSMDLLPIVGAIPVYERIVMDRNRITAGGVTSGIDFGLFVAAQLRGREVAEEIQLMLEYDPAPPFNSGSPSAADPRLVEKIKQKRSAFQQQTKELLTRIRAGM